MTQETAIAQSYGDGHGRWIKRRAFVRYQCAPATPGKITIDDSERHVLAWVQDLSRKGAGLTLNAPIPGNQQITIEISSPSGNEKHELVGTVIHVSQHINGDWTAGLQFSQEISDDVLDVLLYS